MHIIKQNLYICEHVYTQSMETILFAFIGAAAAYSLWVWMGKPNADTGEYSTGMLLSGLGRWLLTKHHENGGNLTIYKLPLCPYCFAVWLTFGAAIFPNTAILAVTAALCTAPFVSLFLFIDKHLN